MTPGVYTFTVDAADHAGNLASTTVGFTVAEPGEAPPAAIDDMDATSRDTPVNVDVAGNDADADGDLDAASVSITKTSAGAVAAPRGGGIVRYDVRPFLYPRTAEPRALTVICPQLGPPS